MQTPITDLVKSLDEVARKRGLYLNRYISKGPGFRIKVTYVVHNSPVRPVKSVSCNGQRVILTMMEGKTERCEAFRKLSSFKAELEKLPLGEYRPRTTVDKAKAPYRKNNLESILGD